MFQEVTSTTFGLWFKISGDNVIICVWMTVKTTMLMTFKSENRDGTLLSMLFLTDQTALVYYLSHSCTK